VTDTYEYDAYGNFFTKTGTTPNNYLYRGEQYDQDLGLYYLRARYYNPNTGRFMSRDPEDGHIKDLISLHKYLYAGGDPVNRLDPSGRANVLQFLFTTAVISSPAELALIRLVGGSAAAISEWMMALEDGMAEITSLLSEAAESSFDATWDLIERAVYIYDGLVTEAGGRGGIVRGISCGILSFVAAEILEHDKPVKGHIVEAVGTLDCVSLLEAR
jgi:RHS repeat-associated protein